jgi:UPF0755 protein
VSPPEFGKKAPGSTPVPSPRKEKSKSAKTTDPWIKVLLVLLILGLLTGLGALMVYDRILPAKFAKPGPLLVETRFEVPRGAGVNLIAQRLETAGLIREKHLFRLKAKMAESSTPLKAGEYWIVPHASIDELFAQMQAGNVIQHAITIPEGLTSRAIMRQLEAEDLLVGKISEVPPEGSLLPETYHVVMDTTRNDMLERMKLDHDRVLAELWSGREADLPIKTPEEAVILASIVEKETGIASERDRVAAVFVNRLRRGMRLESDPTILYGLNGGEPLGRGLRRSEIDRKNAWSTYQIDGLPPTAICNPGRAAMYATLHPAKTRDLYFVADGSGGHAFAKTYAAHLANVAKWRKIERARRRAGGLQ